MQKSTGLQANYRQSKCVPFPIAIWPDQNLSQATSVTSEQSYAV